MTFTEKDSKRIAIILLLAVLLILSFLVIRPVLMSIIGGLILAYVFYPVHKRLVKYVKYPTLSASIITILVIIAILVPLWFLAPIIVQKVFELFQISQNFDSTALLNKIFPGSNQLVTQASLAINNSVGKVSSLIVNTLISFLVNFALVSLHILLVGFVFFFALRDEQDLRDFASGLSPLQKTQEKKLVKQFKDITNSIIYGQIIIGLIQGLLAGVALWLFGVPNVLVFTIVALILSIIPVIGPGFLYVPITFYLVVVGSPFTAAGYFLFNLLIVSTIDNVLRIHIVSRNSEISQVIALIGMVGGLLIFGILGLILGPLILAYLITFLRAYKDKTLPSFFEHTT